MPFHLVRSMTSRATVSHRNAFQASPEAEGRLLLLIDAFSRTRNGHRALEGRIKLAKLDFLIRYPKYLASLLRLRAGVDGSQGDSEDDNAIEQRMIRYRYGPWDPAYYAVLGSLIGRGLIEVVPISRGFGYRTTDKGAGLAESLANDDSWAEMLRRISLVRRHLDKSGTTLKSWIYEAFPEIGDATWQEPLP